MFACSQLVSYPHCRLDSANVPYDPNVLFRDLFFLVFSELTTSKDSVS